MTLTEQQKYEKPFRENLARITNKVKLAFQVKKLKTFSDYLDYAGYDSEYKSRFFPNELAEVITWSRLQELIGDLRISQDVQFYLMWNPPAGIGVPKVVNVDEIFEDDYEKEHNKDYGLVPSAKEKCTLFWFQKKYAQEILDGIHIKDYRGQLLVAGAGLGKTFIGGAVIRRLLDIGFQIGKTVSPWPYCWITKAAVVEQTKRVLEKWFQINTTTECFVCSYDALRATFGSLFLEEKPVIVNGEQTREWTWRPLIHPCFFFIDEIQAAKNASLGTTQGEIICSIAKITDAPVYVVGSSATPFTRVSEAKALVLNLRIEERLV